MSILTIRNVDADVKRRLRVRAARHGRSMEEEVRTILRDALGASAPDDLAAAIRARMAPLDGVELDLPARDPMRAAPAFD